MPKLIYPRCLLSIFVVTAFCISAFSQKKYLTQEQMLKNKMPAIVIPLPQFISWKEDALLVFDKKFYPDTSLKTITIDPNSGQETITAKNFTKPVDNSKRVYEKGGELYFSAVGIESRLTDNKEEELNAKLSPDSSLVAFTRKNNLYVIDLNSKKETQLTTDGNDSILNGYSSWVYYEEILNHRYGAFWWSPDNKHLAFFRADESPVPVFTITDATGQHGLVQRQRYPKVGDRNPEIKIGIVSFTDNHITWADFNEHDDQYFGLPYWRPDGSSLLVQWMNRDQNNLRIYDINIKTGAKKEFYNETQKTWIELSMENRVWFLKNGKGCIITSDQSGWMQLYYHDNNGKLINPVTSGKYTITGIQWIDEKKELVFFTARKENSTRSDLYSIRLNGNDLKRLTFGEFNNDIRMSPSGGFFITTYNNVSTPGRIALLDNKGKFIKEIGNAKGPEFDDYHLSKTEIINVKSEDGLYDLPVLIRWPLNLDSTRRYPIIFDIYGGPNASSAIDFWSFSRTLQWYAKEGVIFVTADHRGSGQFGKEGANNLYRNLGYWEMKDYSTVAKWLIDKGYADPKKIAIRGYSYGGYATCYALTYGADVFTHGMAGSSVTDWSLYDTHYTERYMGTPLNNPEGYKTSSVLNYTDKYKGKLLMTHGVMDDNVHMQNSGQLISKLEDLRKDFEFYMYSGGTHGDLDFNKQLHFQNVRTQFIYKYLLEKPVPDGLLR